MPRKIRAYACADCGRWTVRPRVSNDPWICEDCGRDRMRYGWANRRHVHKLTRQAEPPPPTCSW